MVKLPDKVSPAVACLTIACALAIVARPQSSARAETTDDRSPRIADIAFLAGAWTTGNGSGAVADTGESSRGTSSFTLEAGGNALLRRDHVDLYKDGKSTGSFDILMIVYPEAGSLHADYTDGTHVIHYGSARVVPGRSVVFASTLVPNAPAYRLRYDASANDTLDVRFDVRAPGETAFHPIATGSLARAK